MTPGPYKSDGGARLRSEQLARLSYRGSLLNYMKKVKINIIDSENSAQE